MNDALTNLGDWLLRVIDLPLGWLLVLPRDLGLLLFALGTALLMTLVRRFATNQDMLHRCSSDLRQLKSLSRAARQAADKLQVARLRSTVGQIKGMQLSQDLRQLAVVLIPVGILAVWASERLDYIPPRPGDELTVRAHFPASSVDRFTHLVPALGIDLKSTAIQIINRSSLSPPGGMAEWTVVPQDTGDFDLTIRHQGESAVHRLEIGGRTYQAPHQLHAGPRLTRTEVRLDRYLPLGSNCGSEWLGLPPWMIGYLILTLVSVPLWKRLLAIA
ncbi:MAG: hypothetical protein JSS49_20000 [Planctomycetes bacterium]|nr:hypothetical protein [Planctomycetota bacterium]